ncbi:hypothetical protein [Teredinibacter waterburyi]|uniref:hypothetical protein n=1 Tax=Teredinibacter waterburyi TaxID=1500538 RepID=UPI00165F2147|nr:hypothetical protein [Teredinibacter waterburyi]
MKKLFLLFSCIYFYGCSAVYIPPENVNLVSVTYVTKSSPKAGRFIKPVMSILKYENGDCSTQTIMGDLFGTMEEPGRVHVQVAAGEQLFNTYSTMGSSGSSMVVTVVGSKFTPVLGHRYEIEVLYNDKAVVRDITELEPVIIAAGVEKYELCRPK